MKLIDFVISLEKCVALFLIDLAASVENILYFYFVRDLDIGLHYLPSPINTHCIKSKNSNKTNFEALYVLHWRSVKNILHFFFLRGLDIGMHYLQFEGKEFVEHHLYF